MSSRYATVRLNSLYLTHDGTATGRLCKVTVQNESAFASPYASNSDQALDFTVHTQVVNRGVRGIPFGLTLEYCPEALLDSIVAELEASLAAGGDVRVVVDSLTDFDVMARPQFQEGGRLFTYESRSGGYARNVRLNFISTSPGA